MNRQTESAMDVVPAVATASRKSVRGNIMRNGSTWKVVSCGAALLFGLMMFILGGWRADMATAATERKETATEVVRHGERLATLEARYENISDALIRIEAAIAKQ